MPSRELAWVIVKIVSGDTLKPLDSWFETAVMGIDMLDIDRTFDMYSMAQLDRVVGDASVPGKTAVGRILPSLICKTSG